MFDMPQRLPVDFIPLSRTYVDRETGVESGLITDLALLRNKVTLNHNYNGRAEEILLGNTLFNEITITAPVVPQSIQNLIDFGDPQANNDVPQIAQAIASVIERRWDPEQFHLVMHSSGYDSRIISQTIASLRGRYGESWLGEVLFLCWEPEGQLFKKIMELEGWRKEQYHVCNEGAEVGEYYAGVLNFDNCWRWTNDAQPPIFINRFTIEQLQESGIVTKPLTKTQLIAGGVGNECFMYRPDYLVKLFYYSRWGAQSCAIPYSERILPFASYDVLRLVKPAVNVRLEERYNEWVEGKKIYSDLLRLVRPVARWVRRGQMQIFDLLKLTRPTVVPQVVRKEILSYLSPELARLKTGIIDGPAAPQRRLSERLRRKCLEDFTNSWYYQNVILPRFPEYDLNVPKNIWTSDWWGVYAKASICEYLIKNGVEIIV